MPFVNLTRAILRSAEFGFFGVIVRTWMQTPRFWGAPLPRCIRFFSASYVNRSAGAEVFFPAFLRPFRTSWFIVGKRSLNLRLVIPQSSLWNFVRHPEFGAANGQQTLHMESSANRAVYVPGPPASNFFCIW